VFTANNDGYDVARDLIEAGVTVAALVDTDQLKTEMPKWLSEYEVECLPNFELVEAQPGSGNRSITGCVLVRHGSVSEVRKIDCDLIVTSVGYAPLGQLTCHSGGQLEYDDTIHAYRITKCPDHGQVAGSANHIYALDAVLQDGSVAGTRAAAAALGKEAPIHLTDVVDRSAVSMHHPYPIYPHKKGKEFVDFDEDQTIADLNNAVADGFSHPELAKRYSTTGMGPSQGRMSATNALRIVAQADGGDLGGRTVTTQRPPYRPVSFAVLAGQSFEPERLSPMHDWHIQNGAELMPAGLWQRPALYRRNGDRQRDIADEVAAIRNSVGLIDVSTLGGIEIRGPDASEFLNRAYTFAYAKQPVGRSRYLLMTDDTGSIIDDGVACRLADDHFYVTTTTTGSDAVYRNMLRQCAEWHLDLTIVNTTSTYAAINVAGPLARTVMSRLDSDIDFSKDAFPYLAIREGLLEGMATRALRVGFVGELSYELHAPSSYALQLWERLMLAGANYKIRAVGVEAQRILRLEKGHIIVGQDTDGLTHPGEASLGWAVAKSKPRFVGRAAINHFESREVDRALVGFRLMESIDHLPEECNIVVDDNAITGRITSIARSAVVGAVIGLAYVSPQQSAIGSEFRIKRSDGQLINATVVDLPFFDPDNTRQEL
jgi:sarcosine oxidase subunit alpha